MPNHCLTESIRNLSPYFSRPKSDPCRWCCARSVVRSSLATMPARQVWPLTQFFCVLFCKKMTPHRGNTILFHSSLQLPGLRPGPLKGFLSWHGALQGPLTCHVRCFRNYRDTRTPSGISRGISQVKGRRQKQLTQTLIVRLLKTHIFTPVPDCKKSRE